MVLGGCRSFHVLVTTLLIYLYPRQKQDKKLTQIIKAFSGVMGQKLLHLCHHICLSNCGTEVKHRCSFLESSSHYHWLSLTILNSGCSPQYQLSGPCRQACRLFLTTSYPRSLPSNKIFPSQTFTSLLHYLRQEW